MVQHGPEDADKQQQGAEEAPRRGLGAGAGSGLGFAPAGAGAGVGAAAGAGFGPAPAPKAGHGGIGFAAAGGGGGIGFSPAGGTGGIGVSPAGGGGGGLGSAGGGGGGGPPGFAKGHASLHEEEEEEEEALLPTAFGRRIQAGAEQRRKQSEAAARVERSKVKAAVGPKADVGKFEAHTKGIGAKLLAKMGWAEGEGLGRDRRVRCVPVHASRGAGCRPPLARAGPACGKLHGHTAQPAHASPHLSLPLTARLLLVSPRPPPPAGFTYQT